MRTGRLTFLAVAVMLSGCARQTQDFYMDFPIREVGIPAFKGTLRPESVTQDGRMVASVRKHGEFMAYLTWPMVSSYRNALVLEDSEGEVVAQLCPFGRGPGEVLSPVPWLDVRSGHAWLYDLMTANCFDVDLEQSLAEGHTVAKVYTLPHESILTLKSFHALPGGRLLGFDQANAVGSQGYSSAPRYRIYDLQSGTQEREIMLFELPEEEDLESPYFEMSDCVSEDFQRVYFVMANHPVLGVVDLQSGKVRGLRVKGLGPGPGEDPETVRYFECVAFHGGRGYALCRKTEGQPETSERALYVLDESGIPVEQYGMDRNYYGIWAEEDGLYLCWTNEDDECRVSRIPWGQLNI